MDKMLTYTRGSNGNVEVDWKQVADGAINDEFVLFFVLEIVRAFTDNHEAQHNSDNEAQNAASSSAGGVEFLLLWERHPVYEMSL